MDKTINFYQPHPINDFSGLSKLEVFNQYSDEEVSQALTSLFQQEFNFQHTYLTSSCTSALEMCAELLNPEKEDEVILPSYTHVSSASPFVKKGCKIVYADSTEQHPIVSIESIRRQINAKTKAVVFVHYAGQSCDMEALQQLCAENKIYLIEDAAHAIGSFYLTQTGERIALGKFGDAACFSFHYSKNISCGEGGLLQINREEWKDKSEEIYQMGTNKADYLKGNINRFEWTMPSSSYAIATVCKRMLLPQLLSWKSINEERIKQIAYYKSQLNNPCIEYLIDNPSVQANGHIYALCLRNSNEKQQFIQHLGSANIEVLEHYFALHLSLFGKRFTGQHSLEHAEKFHHRLVRLPMHGLFTEEIIEKITKAVNSFTPA